MYKIVDIIFCITFKILSKLQELSRENVKKNLFCEYLSCITLKDGFLGPSFYFCFKVYKVDDSLTFIWKKILCHIFLYFYVVLSFGSSGMNCKLIRREYGFSINSKIPFMNSSDEPILTLKILVTYFCRF